MNHEHQVTPPTLGGLAFCSYVYGALTSYDNSLDDFRARSNGRPELEQPEERFALISWLNQWGCRLPNAHHALLADRLGSWYKEHRPLLPDHDRRLQTMSDSELAVFAPVFSALVGLGESLPENGAKTKFRSTAASKTLFALQPYAFVAWDRPIRTRLGLGESGEDYVRFLIRVREDLIRLAEEARTHDLELAELPQLFGREQSTPADLVNRFYWVTLTRKLQPPSSELLERWANWSRQWNRRVDTQYG